MQTFASAATKKYLEVIDAEFVESNAVQNVW